MLNQTIEWIARRERAVVSAGLAVIIVLAWAFLFARAGMDMSDMNAARHAGSEGWSGGPVEQLSRVVD